MKKILNFRPLFYCFIALGLGVYFTKPIFSLNIFVWVFVGILLISLLTISIIRKSILKFLLVFTAFIVGICIFQLSNYNFSKTNFGEIEHSISGRVDVCSTYPYSQSIVLNNIYVDGEKTNVRIKVSVSGGSDLDIGNIVTFNSVIDNIKLFELNKFNSYCYKYNVEYSSAVKYSDLTVDAQDSLTWSETLQNSIKKVLYSNMNDDMASLGYASIFGDQTLIDDDIQDVFSISGTVHLLAVSGSHIGFFVALFTMLLKKVKIKNYFKVLIISIILALYCVLCSFAISVVRAAIMFLILSGAQLLGKKYDRLNSLGLAGLVVMIFKPLIVFDAGFLLSFGSVLSIFLFMNIFKQWLEKLKLPKFFCESFSVIMATQIGLLPLMAIYSSQTTILSFIANLICIPLFEIYFEILFICLIFVLLLPFMGFVFFIPNILMSVLVSVCTFIANIKWAYINLAPLSAVGIVGIYLAMFMCSRFINLKLKIKSIIVGCILVITSILSLGIKNYNKDKFSIATINSYGSLVYALEFNNNIFLVGEFNDSVFRACSNYLIRCEYRTAKNTFVFNQEKLQTSTIMGNLYYASNIEDDNNLKYNQKYNISGVEVIPYYNNKNFVGYLFTSDYKSVFVSTSQATKSNLWRLDEIYDVDILLTTDKYDNLDYGYNFQYVINNGSNIKNLKTKDNLDIDGNFTFLFNNDNIVVRSLD